MSNKNFSYKAPQLKIIVGVMIMFVLFLPIISAGWWDSGWINKKEINITGGISALTNYPIFLKIANETGMQSNYGDLRFINSSETGKLDYEIDYYNSSEAGVWVKIPTLKNIATGNTTIYVYYNHPFFEVNSEENSGAVFGNNSLAVYHASNNDSSVNDSSIMKNNLTLGNNILLNHSGYFGKQLFFRGLGAGNGIGESINNIGISGNSPMTIEAWIRLNTTTPNGFMFGLGEDATDGYAFIGAVQDLGIDYWNIQIGNASAGINKLIGTSDINPHYLVYSYNGTASELFIDTIKIDTFNSNHSLVNRSLFISGINSAGSQRKDFYLDDFRIYNITQSSAWINRSIQLNASSYYSIGEELTNSSIFVEISQSYDTPIYETTIQNFTMNFTYNFSAFSSVSGNLNYNGTIYTGTILTYGNQKVITTNLSVSSVTSSGMNHTFFWNISLVNSSGTNYFTSTYHNQTILKGTSLIIGTECPASTLPALNFTFFYEQNLTSSNATIDYYLTYGLGGNNNAYSLNATITKATSFAICINATQDYYNVGYGELQYAVDGTSNRRYYIFGGTRLTNETTNIPVYSLETASSTAFLFTATTPSLTPYTNYYISMLRWYPELNSYRVVDMGKTDDKGQSILNVKVESVDYRIGVYDSNGNLIQLFDPIRMVCQTAPCTYSLFVDLTPLDLTAYTNIQSSLSFNPTTEIFTFIWNDPSQTSQTMNLTIWKSGNLYDEAVCSSSSTGYTGVLVCDVSAYGGTLKAQVVRTASPSTIFKQLIVSLEDTFIDAGGGTLGLFIGAILLIFFALIGTISPIIVVILGIISLVPLYLLGNITLEIFMGLGVIGGVILHFIRRVT